MLSSVGLQVRASPKVLATQKGEKLFPARCSQWYAVIHEMVVICHSYLPGLRVMVLTCCGVVTLQLSSQVELS